MMFSKKKRRATRKVFGWMMSGYLVVLVALGASSMLFVPQEAEAVDVCYIAGACMKKKACEEAGGDFRNCRTLCSAKNTEVGCGKCKTNEGYCFPPRKGIELAIHIGDTKRVYDTSQYLETVYDFAIGIAGGIAGVMLMIGGFQYLTAGGAADRVSAAKKRISDALVGLALTLGAFLILNTISPDLVNMSELRVPMIEKKVFSACNDFVMKKPCGEEFGLVGEPPEIGAGEECVGQSCKLAGANDAFYQCANSNPQNRPVATFAKKAVDPYQCIVCDGIDTPCTDVGDSDQCCTGFCAKNALTGGGVCASGEAGSKCKTDSECKSGICQGQTELTSGNLLNNSCSEGLMGSPCDEDKECTGGNVCLADVCTLKGISGGPCVKDTDCPSEHECKTLAGADGGSVCAAVGAGTCVRDSGCPNGYYCNVKFFYGTCVKSVTKKI
ncbi:pilin [Patescibacteria group bacterium]